MSPSVALIRIVLSDVQDKSNCKYAIIRNTYMYIVVITHSYVVAIAKQYVYNLAIAME